MAQIEKEHEAPAKGNYAFVSLGCPKNTVDSERMLGLLQLGGYQLVGDPKNADFVVVNTCGFIEEARKESYGAIDEMIALKNDGVIKGVVVSGCLAERQKEELLEDSDFFQLVDKSKFKILMNKRKLKNSENKLLFSLINVKYFIDGQNEH